MCSYILCANQRNIFTFFWNKEHIREPNPHSCEMATDEWMNDWTKQNWTICLQEMNEMKKECSNNSEY